MSASLPELTIGLHYRLKQNSLLKYGDKLRERNLISLDKLQYIPTNHYDEFCGSVLGINNITDVILFTRFLDENKGKFGKGNYTDFNGKSEDVSIIPQQTNQNNNNNNYSVPIVAIKSEPNNFHYSYNNANVDPPEVHIAQTNDNNNNDNKQYMWKKIADGTLELKNGHVVKPPQNNKWREFEKTLLKAQVQQGGTFQIVSCKLAMATKDRGEGGPWRTSRACRDKYNKLMKKTSNPSKTANKSKTSKSKSKTSKTSKSNQYKQAKTSNVWNKSILHPTPHNLPTKGKRKRKLCNGNTSKAKRRRLN